MCRACPFVTAPAGGCPLTPALSPAGGRGAKGLWLMRAGCQSSSRAHELREAAQYFAACNAGVFNCCFPFAVARVARAAAPGPLRPPRASQGPAGNSPKGRAMDRARRRRYTDVPSADPGRAEKRRKQAVAGAPFFRFPFLGEQKRELAAGQGQKPKPKALQAAKKMHSQSIGRLNRAHIPSHSHPTP